MPTQRKELIELLRLDYDQSMKLVDGIVRTVTTIRGWGLTLWSALLALCVQKDAWQFGVIGIAIIGAVALIDTYHSRLYRLLLKRARAIEDLLASYYAALGRGAADPTLQSELDVALETHSFGVWRNQRRLDLWELVGEKPLGFFWGVYALLAIVSGGIATSTITLADWERVGRFFRDLF